MSSEHHENQLSHVASVKSLLGTFGALIALTILTVAVRAVDFGSANLVIAMIIACTKATLVILFFMHLAHDRPFNGMAVGLGILAIVLFIAICLIDTGQYHEGIIGFDGDYQTPDFSHGGGHGEAVGDPGVAPDGATPAAPDAEAAH